MNAKLVMKCTSYTIASTNIVLATTESHIIVPVKSVLPEMALSKIQEAASYVDSLENGPPSSPSPFPLYLNSNIQIYPPSWVIFQTSSALKRILA
jgi:hypothetical protein